MNPYLSASPFQKSYALSPGLYLWAPLIGGVVTLVVVCVMLPPMILAAPFVIGVALFPSWLLGGRLHIHAEPGRVRLTRQRWTWNIVKELMFPPGEVPQVQATRPWGHRPHGRLRVSASTGYCDVETAMHDALAPAAADLQAYFGR